MLKEGDPAPDFTLPDADGKAVTLSGFRGRYVVLYFYPKDDTSGCTREALDFTGLKPEFDKLGAEIAGVSPDGVKAHAKFAGKHNLKVLLLADEAKAVLEAYGVWKQKKMYGREYMGVERSTFLIGPDGTVLHGWRGVKVTGHAKDVLAAIKKRQ